MGILMISLIAIGLAMDAFAVAICKGLSMKKFEIKKAVIIALYFGIFQGLMPIAGFFIGNSFTGTIEGYEHWITLVLLGVIGINMIREAFDKDDIEINEKVNFKTMILLAIITSIDALITGITFSFWKVNIWFAALTIGIITYVFSLSGVIIGTKFGAKHKAIAEVTGGVILILTGIKFVIEHFGII